MVRLEEDLLQAFIAAYPGVRWITSKTYAKKAPHQYAMKDQYPEFYNIISELIQHYGYDEWFYKTKFRYYAIDGKKYWAYNILVNRTEVENVYK